MARGRSASGRTTLADVAALAGVDRSVVSRVLNNDPALNVRADTRERVQRAIQSLNYRPNAAARSLRTDRAGTLALLIPDFLNPVYAEIIVGAEAAANRHDCVLVTGSQQGPGQPRQAQLDLIDTGRVDGILLAGGALTRGEQRRLESSGVPWLLLNRRVRGSTRYVALDDVLGARTAVRHLVSLGHRCIGHIGGPATADTARRRHQGWVDALRHEGIDPTAMPMASGDYTPEGGATALHDLLRRNELPSALFVANVASAIGVLKAASRLGISVPTELSIIAIHDMPLASFLTPSLTTVRMPLRQLGAQAVDLLMTRAAGDVVTETVGFPVDLVERESTAPPRSG